MNKYSVMGNHPGDGGMVEAENHLNAFINFLNSETGDINKEAVRMSIERCIKKGTIKVTRFSGTHVKIGAYEVKQITEE